MSSELCEPTALCDARTGLRAIHNDWTVAACGWAIAGDQRFRAIEREPVTPLACPAAGSTERSRAAIRACRPLIVVSAPSIEKVSASHIATPRMAA
jgi:hypothetical protein